MIALHILSGVFFAGLVVAEATFLAETVTTGWPAIRAALLKEY